MASSSSGERRLPTALVVAFLVGAVLMVPWTIYLGYSLPRREVTKHYDAMWVGFDLLLIVVMLRVAYLAARRRRQVEISAAVLATLLVVDAWFDLMSSSGHRQFMTAVATAVFVELPTALLALSLVFRVEGIKVGRPHLERRALRALAVELGHPSSTPDLEDADGVANSTGSAVPAATTELR